MSYEMLMGLYAEVNAVKDSGNTFETYKAMKRAKVWMLSLTVADEEGALLFNDDEGRSILEKADNNIIEDLYDHAQNLCDMSEVQIEQEKKESLEIVSNGSSVPSALHSAVPSVS